MTEAPQGTAEGFTAARAHFTRAADAARGAIKSELEIYPREPGDHYDRTQLGPLRTGDLLAFKATGDRQTVLTGYAAPDGTATLTPGLADALRAGEAIDQPEPGLARLFAAAKLGADDALPYADVKKRIEFLFPFARINRLCPLTTEGDTVRVRWQLTVTDASPNTPRGPGAKRGTVKTHPRWLTATYDRAAATARLTTGDEGC
ncbi:MAG: hypothetical protein H6701_06665 [Myxococcales bacterium]|nr:hypothetical protein [Myxococcales bacterium]